MIMCRKDPVLENQKYNCWLVVAITELHRVDHLHQCFSNGHTYHLGSCKHASSESACLGWSPSIIISNKLPNDVNEACQYQTTLGSKDLTHSGLRSLKLIQLD